jgi:MFS family permease
MKIESWRTPLVVMIGATVILFTSFGVRQSYGLLMDPISSAHGWGREVFAFAVALQSLIWGISQPVWGAIADRYGAGRVVSISSVLYAAGLYLMSTSTTPLGITFSTGFLTGVGLSGASFPIILAVVARSVSAKRRSLFLGITSAGGSSGQLLVVPITQSFISADGYVAALVMLAVMTAMIVPLAVAVSGRKVPEDQVSDDQTMSEAVREAGRHGGFLLLIAGFFVCGFQTMFIGAHLPAYLADAGASPMLGATALATIGLFNVIGCFIWGALGGRYSKKYMLAMLYMARSAVMLVFILTPVSEISVLVFSAAIGLLWLATVPLTSGLVAQLFGTRYMAMLYGFVFLNHQIGSFFGIWLGGRLFDQTGSYDVIWWMAIALGLVAALLHWPIDERAVARLSTARQVAERGHG